nr:isoform 1 of cyclic amp-dependent transcription factor atf-7 [Quercus suber]
MIRNDFRGQIALPSQPDPNTSAGYVSGSDRDQQRKVGATKRFGQITPPNDDKGPGPGPAPNSLGNRSLSKFERARNAANQRHSRDRRDSRNVASEPGEEEARGAGEKKERYREKNRQAAAKCRDKKKKNTEELDRLYKMAAGENAAMKQEVRLLRDEFCRIRELALQHAPEHCTCSSLHAFNMQQVIKEASQMAGTMGGMQMMDMSVDGRYGSDVTSPGSADTLAHAHMFSDAGMGFDYGHDDLQP